MSVFTRRRAGTDERAITPDKIPWNRSNPTSLLDQATVSALRLIPVYAATTMVTDSISTCPLKAHEGTGTALKVSATQPKLLTEPGPLGLDIVTWLGQLTMSLLLRGNGYGRITLFENDRATQIKWLHPDHVVVDEHGAVPIYRYKGVEIPRELVVHVPGVCMPGSVVGLSPISLFRAQIETGLRAGELASNWYAEGVAPQAILYNKTRPLESGEAATAKALLKEAVADRDVLVTGNDWGWLPLSVSPADAQFLEQISATATEVAAIFHLAPEDIGGKSGESMTYSTLESNDLKYTRRAVLPWMTRIEHALTRHFPVGQYAKFNLGHLARADLKTRMEAHAIALDNGVLTLDEARALEDKAPLTPDELAAWQEHFVVPRPAVISLSKGA